jgi:hypothetical protein
MNRTIFSIACLVVAGVLIYLVLKPPTFIEANNATADQKKQSSTDTKNPEEINSMPNEYNQLTAEESRVILAKGTEHPGTGEHNSTTAAGV